MNKRQQFSEVLQNSQIFNELNEDENYQIALYFERAAFNEDEYVFTANEEGNVLYVVETGELLLELSGKPVKTFRKGDIFGEVAMINESLRTGSIKALKDSSLLFVKSIDLLDEYKIPCSTILKIYKKLAKLVTSYLRNAKHTTTNDLILEGENEFVEFKASLRWNNYTKKFDKNVENACLKTIAAFVNSNGGTLLIGVTDNGEICGVEHDLFENNDKMLLHLSSIVRERLSFNVMSLINCQIEMVKRKKVLRVDCEHSPTPVYFRYNNEEHFFIRTGPATGSLPVSQVYDYIRFHFFEM